MIIKILKPVKLHKDLTKYVSKSKSEFVKREAGDILIDVNDKYKDRYSKFPDHIEIIEEPKVEENNND